MAELTERPMANDDKGLVEDARACVVMADEIVQRGHDVLPGKDADGSDADMSILETPVGGLALDATLCAANSAAIIARLADRLGPLLAALSERDRRIGRLEEGLIEGIALLDVALAGTLFTRPRTGQIIVNRERAEKTLETLRAAFRDNSARSLLNQDSETGGEG